MFTQIPGDRKLDAFLRQRARHMQLIYPTLKVPGAIHPNPPEALWAAQLLARAGWAFLRRP